MAEKIFLLEDDAYLRDGLLEMLQGRDYEVESAESIKKAEIIIKEKRFSQTGFRPLYFSACLFLTLCFPTALHLICAKGLERRE